MAYKDWIRTRENTVIRIDKSNVEIVYIDEIDTTPQKMYEITIGYHKTIEETIYHALFKFKTKEIAVDFWEKFCDWIITDYDRLTPFELTEKEKADLVEREIG